MDERGDQRLLTGILKQVSRSFYLTLKALPSSVRPQIGLAYLLARTSDTIADTELIPAAQRLDALKRFERAILDGSSVDFSLLAGQQALPAERVILERANESLALLRGFEAADRGRIQRTLEIIISGQALDLERFHGASKDRIVALADEPALDDYTYRVAGCVGEFWTEMTLAHPLRGFQPPTDFTANGIKFGQGLQLVNILRDLPRDLLVGRCYLPLNELRAAGLSPDDLLDPSHEPRVKPIYDRLLSVASARLEDGWRYTCAIPRKQMRLRLACAWPLLIGIRTLRLLRDAHFLDANARVKVSRSHIRSTIARSVFTYPFRRQWENLFWAR